MFCSDRGHDSCYSFNINSSTDNMMEVTHTCTQIMQHKDIIVSLNVREEEGEKQAGSHCVREEKEGFMGIIPFVFQTNCFS